MHNSTAAVHRQIGAYNLSPTDDQKQRAGDVRRALALAADEVGRSVKGPDATHVMRLIHQAQLAAVASIMHEDTPEGEG